MSLEQAKHNEDLCHKLHSENIWNDWVVTTAFYSAVHFTESRLFPLQIKETVFQNFDEYYSQLTDRCRSQHTARLNLVRERLRKAYSAYRFLYENCRTARYYNYKTPQSLANEAKIKLAVIKSLCVPVEKPKE